MPSYAVDEKSEDPAYQVAHWRLMVNWWSGNVLPTVHDRTKAEDAATQLQRWCAAFEARSA